MKFFTQGWHGGEVDEPDAHATFKAYSRYLAGLRLPPEVEALSEVYVHDAYFLRVEHQPKCETLFLRLRCGDLQRGYCDVILNFAGVIMTPSDMETLHRSLRPADVEVLYEEVDRSENHFEYRLLLWPYAEVTIGFSAVEISTQPVTHRHAD